MFECIEFQNYKALRNTELPLSRFTLIVGANGSGKSTALNAIFSIRDFGRREFKQIRTAGTPDNGSVTLRAEWRERDNGYNIKAVWTQGVIQPPTYERTTTNSDDQRGKPELALHRARMFLLSAEAIARSVQLQPRIELDRNGANLAGVLDRLRDEHPERFDTLTEELGRWIPEFDAILFNVPRKGHRSLALRTREGKHSIQANDLSHGTLIALALLTIAYLPEPPSIVCLEEPDHGLHPRLLRGVKDALYRLAFPEDSGQKREPVQVIATTHNPYFLDQFQEHPEQIVIAEKVGLEAKFSRPSDRKDLDGILADAPLSEVWYSGVIGGVPAGT